MYASRVPAGTVKVHVEAILLKADEPKTKGFSISEITDVKPRQFEKARAPMVVTLLGMVADVNPLQPLKAD